MRSTGNSASIPRTVLESFYYRNNPPCGGPRGVSHDNLEVVTLKTYPGISSRKRSLICSIYEVAALAAENGYNFSLPSQVLILFNETTLAGVLSDLRDVYTASQFLRLNLKQ